MNPSSFSHRWDNHTRDEIIRYQNQRLHRYLKEKVLPNSQHYSKLFAEHDLTADDIQTVEDLQKVPFTYKQDLINQPGEPSKTKEFILIPDPKEIAKQPRTIARALWKGRKAVKAEIEREFRPIFMTSTTGRSTEPVPFLYTQYDLDNLAQAGSRLTQICQAESDDKILNMFPYAPHLAYWFAHYAAMKENIFALGTGGGKVMGTDGNLRLINKLTPTILVGMPTFVYHVLHQAMNEKKAIKGLKIIVLGGEKVAPGTRRKLAQMADELGSPNVKVVSTYGFTEAKIAWVECPFTHGTQSGGYHIYPDMSIIEIIDPNTGRVVPDGQPGEIVYTPLDARGSTVFRYRTGDYAEGGLTYEACPHCGRVMPRITGKISRSSDVKSMQLQKFKGTLVDFNSLELLLDDIDSIGTWQLEMRKVNNDPLDLDELVLHVSPNRKVSQEVLTEEVNAKFAQCVEIRPNRIAIHSAAEMRKRHKVGEVMKEEKVVDNREQYNPEPQSSPTQPKS